MGKSISTVFFMVTMTLAQISFGNESEKVTNQHQQNLSLNYSLGDHSSNEVVLITKSFEGRKNRNFQSGNYQQISNVLQAEARVQTINEAIDLKTRGLRYVSNMAEFEYLTTTPFPNPTEGYKNAVADFIVLHINNYAKSFYDIDYIRVLETRSVTISRSMAIKAAGLLVARDIFDFNRVIQYAFNQPSDGYKQETAKLIVNNIASFINFNTPIFQIIESEKLTIYTSESIAVKNAGLAAVRSQSQLFELAQYAFRNPSDGYRNEVDKFVSANITNYPY